MLNFRANILFEIVAYSSLRLYYDFSMLNNTNILHELSCVSEDNLLIFMKTGWRLSHVSLNSRGDSGDNGSHDSQSS